MGREALHGLVSRALEMAGGGRGLGLLGAGRPLAEEALAAGKLSDAAISARRAREKFAGHDRMAVRSQAADAARLAVLAAVSAACAFARDEHVNARRLATSSLRFTNEVASASDANSLGALPVGDACELCRATLLSGSHGPGVCALVPGEPPSPTWDARYVRGAAQGSSVPEQDKPAGCSWRFRGAGGKIEQCEAIHAPGSERCAPHDAEMAKLQAEVDGRARAEEEIRLCEGDIREAEEKAAQARARIEYLRGNGPWFGKPAGARYKGDVRGLVGTPWARAGAAGGALRLDWRQRRRLHGRRVRALPVWTASAGPENVIVTQTGDGVFLVNGTDIRPMLEAAQLLAEEQARAGLRELAKNVEAGLVALGRGEAAAWFREHVDPEAVPWRERAMAEPLVQALLAAGALDGEAADIFASAYVRAKLERGRAETR